MILPRRRFLQVLTGLIAAPAVVKADALMRVVAPPRHALADFFLGDTLTAEEIERAIRPPIVLDRDWEWEWRYVNRVSLPVIQWRELGEPSAVKRGMPV